MRFAPNESIDKMIVGTGVDITEVSRMRRAVERWGNEFLNRIFTKEELENAKTRGSYFQHLAGRFAAKEAIFKAINYKDMGWKDVTILNDKNGKPYCKIFNPKVKNVQIHLSISHVKSYAVASAFITKKA